ncbi:MAG: translesion DNA synthesis-associated protein ImuA [Gammaproteobacteria bacterium]
MGLEAVLQDPRVWRLGRESPARPAGIATGFAALDALLPGRGWPRGALTEIVTAGQGSGALGLLIPALADLSQSEQWLAWIDPPYLPYAPALARRGIDLARVLIVLGTRTRGEMLWAVEQALRSGACGAVLVWLRSAHPRELRRLQLAAEVGQCWGVVFRPSVALDESSPAALRLLVASPSTVHILKRRGGEGVVRLDLRDPAW